MGKSITLNHITKIEGHAKLTVKVDKGKVKKCELSSTEGARYFEGIVKGRHYFEAHEMTSRICGICSCAHVVCAITAIEDALGVKVTKQTKQLRLLMTLAERIRSHATHLYFLALPDYLGYGSALAMAKKYKPELTRALSMMRVGNGLITLLGGRDLHPVSATVGGWLSLPTQKEIDETRQGLLGIKEAAIETCKLFSSLETPEFQSKGKWFSLKNPKGYAVLEGRFSFGRESMPKKQYRQFIREHHEPYSSANFVVKDGHRYMVGALPRLNNSASQLSTDAKKMLKMMKLKLPSTNPYDNNLAQAIELVHCIDHAAGLCRSLRIKEEKPVKVTPKKGRGVGMIEVPRGTLWHEYALDDHGLITDANIITPTAQNLLNIQEDIREFLPTVLKNKKEDIILDIEKLIRSYDPCFSCSAHFLEVDWE